MNEHVIVGPQSEPAPAAADAPSPRRHRDLVAVNAGNTLEWFDWNIYAIFTPFFAGQFFTQQDQLSNVLSVLAVFAVGFLMRPVGGWVFGHIADLRGRRFSLVLAIVLAALGSLLIAISPTSGQIGAWSAVLLVVARLVQGLSHGGETGSAFTYLAEVAPPGRRGLWASTPWLGVGLGSMMATGLGAALTSALSTPQMRDFGWRIPFAVGAALGLYALYIRRTMAESHVYQAAQGAAAAHHSPPLGDVVRRVWEQRKAVLRIVGLTISGVVVFYTWFIFAPGYATTVFKMDARDSLVAGLCAQAVFLVALVSMGRLSDRIGRRPVQLIFSIGFVVAAIPLELLLGTAPISLFLTMAGAILLISANCGPIGAVFAELVPTRSRATLIGVGYATSAAIFGGTAPYLNTWLSSQGRHLWFVGYLMALCAITTVTVLRMPETRDVDLAHSDTAA